MIIYGTRSKQVNHESLMEKCPSCGSQNTVDMYIIQRYFHVFWIPFFPIGKVPVSQCSHCKQALKYKEMPASLKLAGGNLKGQSKTPYFTFIGVALLAVLITVAVIEGRKTDERNAALIKQPQKGDVYEVRTQEGNYTIYKVDHVSNDTAYLFISQYESNKATALYQLMSKPYMEETFAFTVKELVDMQSKGEIIGVKRN